MLFSLFPHSRKSLSHFTLRIAFACALIGACALPIRSGWAAASATDAEVEKKECGACHYPYARDWLPAYSWKQIMDHLDDHFGENAMLDEKTRQRISAYLIGGRSTAVPMRITESDWWVRAHGGGDTIKAYAEQKGFKVSNCEKCHR